MFGKKPKTSAKRKSVEVNPAETFAELGTSLAKSLTTDLAKEAVVDMWTQLLGAEVKKPSESTHGDLAEGQELNLAQLASNQETISRQEAEPGLDYHREIVHGEKQIAMKHSRETQVQIQEILLELRQLIASSKELQIEFKQVTTDQRITTPGKYYVSFFSWILEEIRKVRMRVEDSAAWLAAFQSKKSKRNYWAMSKKHGTSFSLSNERVVATQTG